MLNLVTLVSAPNNIVILSMSQCLSLNPGNREQNNGQPLPIPTNLATLPIVAVYGRRTEQFVVAGYHNILEVR